jgi:type II secretory pathway pseudopilin PulG
LVISIGILILMLALAGQVFTITVRSTGQATALTETSQLLRMFEDTLREDLRSVQPGQSLILIQGNPVNAYWTQGGKDADIEPKNPSDGYGHTSDPEREDADGNLVAPRADILMIFTSRKGTSYTNPNVTGRLQQVVYGHAELGEYVTPTTAGGPTDPQFAPAPTAFPLNQPDYPSTTGVSPVPAAQWHLARRSVVLLPTAPQSGGESWVNIQPTAKGGLGFAKILEGVVDVVGDFRFEEIVLHPIDPKAAWGSQGLWFPPSVFGNTLNQPFSEWHKPYARSWLDVTPPPIYASRLGHYFLPNCASFKVEWSLDPKSSFVAGRLDGTSEVFWFDPGDMGDPSRTMFTGPDPLYSLQARIEELSFKTDSASKKRMNTLNKLLTERTQHADGSVYSLSDRFRGPSWPGADPNYTWDQLAPDGRPNLEVFTATRPTTTGSDAPDDVWPGALRITVDVFDRERRLDRPTRHVIVVPIGG